MDLLHRIDIPGIPTHDLPLKVNGLYLIMRNLAKNLPNGTCIRIIHIQRYTLTVEVVRSREIIHLPRIPFKQKLTNTELSICRKQFPIMPAYAITIHKAQGATLDRVGLDLRSDTFTHGHLHVALTRTKLSENIRILAYADRIQSNQQLRTKHIFYETLLD